MCLCIDIVNKREEFNIDNSSQRSSKGFNLALKLSSEAWYLYDKEV
jgi:hypothetical protein